MNKYILTALAVIASATLAYGQANIYPAKPQSQKTIIMGGTIHTGEGQVINNGFITFEKGKITGIGDATTAKINTDGARVITANGKHIYPGFISLGTELGLIEVESIKATNDKSEMGDMNANIRSISSYNTDSKVIPTLRTNGLLMAQITPQGGTISGSSSVVQLDAWNWEDASLKTDDALHISWPSSRGRGGFGGGMRGAMGGGIDLNERSQNAINGLTTIFTEAKNYGESKAAVVNSRLAAIAPLFKGGKKLFISANGQKDIVAAVNFAKSFGITPVIMGGSEAHLIVDFLKANQIIIVANNPHALPSSIDEEVNAPYKNVARLTKAGLTVAISYGTGDGYWRQRSLPFVAGTASTWGMDKEEALKTITLNAAKALGMEKNIGSLAVGKDATLFISGGDALDMIGNNVEEAFIQGRSISLDNLHKQLNERYNKKYNIK